MPTTILNVEHHFKVIVDLIIQDANIRPYCYRALNQLEAIGLVIIQHLQAEVHNELTPTRGQYTTSVCQQTAFPHSA